jgi:hypothetical protein
MPSPVILHCYWIADEHTGKRQLRSQSSPVMQLLARPQIRLTR